MRLLNVASATALQAVLLILPGSLPLYAQTADPASAMPVATESAPSTLPPSSPAEQSNLHIGDYVQTIAGGPTMRVRAINGDQAICDVPTPNGSSKTASFPVAQLTVVQRPGEPEPPLVEPAPYRPCPANVVQDGKHECRG
jgi:hypothetical protein